MRNFTFSIFQLTVAEIKEFWREKKNFMLQTNGEFLQDKTLVTIQLDGSCFVREGDKKITLVSRGNITEEWLNFLRETFVEQESTIEEKADIMFRGFYHKNLLGLEADDLEGKQFAFELAIENVKKEIPVWVKAEFSKKGKSVKFTIAK